MSTIANRATQLYTEEGFCCAESVWLAFAERDNISTEDKNLGNKLSFAFCGGTGAKNLCGAAAAGALVLGNHFGRVPGEPRNEELPKYTKALIDSFEEQYGYTTCLELKPDAESSVSKQVCKGYVAFIATQLERLLEERPDETGEEERANCT
ncbi:MAG: C-GCAxxG-C-C family protein [Coriobacteriia bacterium]|nr:C-GCAxxG-C-C family protein [Coriobacteriia bacterium]